MDLDVYKYLNNIYNSLEEFFDNLEKDGYKPIKLNYELGNTTIAIKKDKKEIAIAKTRKVQDLLKVAHIFLVEDYEEAYKEYERLYDNVKSLLNHYKMSELIEHLKNFSIYTDIVGSMLYLYKSSALYGYNERIGYIDYYSDYNIFMLYSDVIRKIVLLELEYKRYTTYLTYNKNSKNK